MRIAIGGPHGSGKTTFVRLVKERLECDGLSVKVIADTARLCPIPVGGSTAIEAQQWILDAQLHLEDRFKNHKDVCLYDGCSLAYLAYYEYCGGRSADAYARVRASILSMDRIVWLPAQERFLIDDGIRPTDPDFQRDIARDQRRLISVLGVRVEALGGDWPEWNPVAWRRFMLRDSS